MSMTMAFILVECCCILLLAAAGVFAAAEVNLDKDCVSEWRYTDYGEAVLSTFNPISRAMKIMEIRPFDHQLSPDIVFLTLRFATTNNYSSYNGRRIARVSEDTNGGEAEVTSTWIATKSKLFSKLSPRLFDSMTLGAMGITPRSNSSVIILPATAIAICGGSSLGSFERSIQDEIGGREVLHSVVKALLQKSQIDTSEWSIEEHVLPTTLESSQVFLFMSAGLLAILGTFITFPFLVFAVVPWCCQKAANTTCRGNQLRPYFASMSITSLLLLLTLVIYWIADAYIYYAEDVSAKILFPNKFLSPFTMNLIFYFLTGLTSFLGGMIFPKCSTSNITGRKLSVCDRLGCSLLSVVLSAGIYHSFFIILALYQDVVTVTAYLVVFGSLLGLLFLGNASVINQFARNGFKGFFPLVVVLELIIIVLYMVSVKSFRNLILGEAYVATSAWLLIVVTLSVLALSFSISVFVLTLRRGTSDEGGDSGGRGQQGAEVRAKGSQQLVTRSPQPGNSECPEVQLAKMLTSVVGAWRKSRGQDEAVKLA